MATTVERSIEVEVPVRTAYNQWTQFEQFPQFMSGVREVRQLTDSTLHWVAEIAGIMRQWNARILEQVPDQRVAWAATEGATNAGSVQFEPLDAGRTLVRLYLEYEPEGAVEKAGDVLGLVARQAEADLARFKTFIESRGVETGAWRGAVDEGAGVGRPGVEAAAPSEGDSGKAGVSAKTVIAGAAAATAAGVAAAGVLKSRSSGDTDTDSDAGTAAASSADTPAGSTEGPTFGAPPADPGEPLPGSSIGGTDAVDEVGGSDPNR